MPAYFIGEQLEITDEAAFQEYIAKVRPTVANHGGRYLVVSPPETVLEGDWRPAVVVVIEFPDMARLRGWYDSAEYAPLKALRFGSSRFNFVAVEGFPQPSG